MKQTLSFTTILIILCAISAYFLPWWSTAIISAMVTYFFGIPKLQAFMIGFISINALWLGLAQFFMITSTSKIIEMVSSIFLNIGTTQLTLVAGLIGGVTAGLGCWSGAAIKEFIQGKIKPS